MSTKIEAGPSAPARSPSSTRQIEGQFVTFEMRAPQLDNDIVAVAPSLLKTETVAFGGSLGEIAAGPFIQQRLGREVPCRSHRPVGLMTNSDGTISTLTGDLLGSNALAAAVIGV